MKAFEKIIGYATEKKELMRIADILKNPDRYKSLGAKTPKGLLLDGAPGLGKTLMANALIEESGRPVFVCRKDRPDGDFVNFIKETFEKATENAPSIVFLDDMDKFANEDERRPNAEEYVTIQSCIDSVKDKEVFVLATTNSKRNLPDSLLRAGRFDRIIDIYLPEYSDALEIIKHYLKGKELLSDIDPEYIAKLLHRRSCATIETIINEAAILAAFEHSEKIKLEHFITASAETVFRRHPFTLFEGEIDLENSDSLHSEIAYHESGHTVVSEILSPESVTLVGIGEYSGCTAKYDKQPNSTSNEILDLYISLAGMAAVELKYGHKGYGNSGDIDAANRAIYYTFINNAHNGFGYLGNGAPSRTSEELLARMDTLTATQIEIYYNRTKAILAQNREFLDKVATKLAEKKLLTMYDIQKIKKECKIKEAVVK